MYTCEQALDQLDILVMESRAIKLFKHCDLDGSGNIGQTEFEVRIPHSIMKMEHS
jgi:hypothetical protein